MATCSIKSKTSAGFTLIEVMIVVAIIGILAAVALPSYNDYVRRGKLPEAFTFLSEYRVKMEQYYQDNKTYGGDCAETASWKFKDAKAKYFTLTCVAGADGQSYTITATGDINAQSHTYTIDNTGRKTTTKFKGETVNKACWLVKGSEC